VPTVLRINGYRFSFYSGDRPEPPHLHIDKAGSTAKIWLEPVKVEYNEGFSAAQMRFILKTINENYTYIIDRWKTYFTV
jgi:hypothetical protein